MRARRGFQRLAPLASALALLLPGCAGPQAAKGCPGDRIGTLDCSGALCQMRYDGEVFTLLREPPPDASRLLALTDVGRFTRKLWYASNTGKFKVYVGGPNHGAAYLFEMSPHGWTAQIERDAYACTD